VLDEAGAKAQEAQVPWLEAKRAIDGAPTAYVCERGRCDRPTSRPVVFARQLAEITPYPSFATTSPAMFPYEGANP
jgi:hypothetical protein